MQPKVKPALSPAIFNFTRSNFINVENNQERAREQNIFNLMIMLSTETNDGAWSYQETPSEQQTAFGKTALTSRPQIVTERKRQKLITISLPHRHKRVSGQFEFIVQLPFPEQVVIIQFISDFTQPQLGQYFYYINWTKLNYNSCSSVH